MRIRKPVLVLPPVYELPLNQGRWCKMKHVITAAKAINNFVCAVDFSEQRLKINTIQLIKKFGILAGEKFATKETILRFSADGQTVRIIMAGENRTPWPETCDAIITPACYVPEPWVRRLLFALRSGCYTSHVCIANKEVVGMRKERDQTGDKVVPIPDRLWANY